MKHLTHSVEIVAPRSKLYKGPFGRLFSELPPWEPGDLVALANEMVELPGIAPDEIASDPSLREQLENDFSSKIPAGYTYFGQFIDHDITFDPRSSLMRRNDPAGLLNHRTPRMDLDNVYGSGPDVSPELYDQLDRGTNGEIEKLLVGQIADSQLFDLPRNQQGIAIIGDPRNDENSIVAQLQLAFILAHNQLVDRARMKGVKDPFEAARNTLRWLYQYIIWNDFIKRICLDEVVNCALFKEDTCDGRALWGLGYKDVYYWKHTPFMPVEFSVAAYRFGHSLVRNSYQTNDPHSGFGNFIPIFSSVGADLRGSRPLTTTNYVQWDWFLQMQSSSGPFPQRTRKIDTKLSNALFFLPGLNPAALALRNLKRGFEFSLPSGTSVAKRLGLTPLKIDNDHDALWFYILNEAEKLPGTNGGQMLGRVGSIIVSATFSGLLLGDPMSYLNMCPDWSPDQDPLLDPNDKIDSDDWELASIIRISGLPVSASDF